MAQETNSIEDMLRCMEHRDSIKRRIDEIDSIPQLAVISRIVMHIARISNTKCLVCLENLARDLTEVGV
ncbi:MAG: hypothetical protein K2P44_11535 [Lachnospiraceae bacterium]|nr:hypothetical protein [Lachnospiraceae bacterium]